MRNEKFITLLSKVWRQMSIVRMAVSKYCRWNNCVVARCTNFDAIISNLSIDFGSYREAILKLHLDLVSLGDIFFKGSEE